MGVPRDMNTIHESTRLDPQNSIKFPSVRNQHYRNTCMCQIKGRNIGWGMVDSTMETELFHKVFTNKIP